MHTPQIVEGVMNCVIHEIGRVVWNCLQEGWGPAWDAPFVPLQCGSVAVEITEQSAGDEMEVVAFGFRVGTWLDSKREFYHAHLPDGWGDHEFVDWAKQVFDELARCDREWREALLNGKTMAHGPVAIAAGSHRLVAPTVMTGR